MYISYEKIGARYALIVVRVYECLYIYIYIFDLLSSFSCACALLLK
jgi:hypothetical protein